MNNYAHAYMQINQYVLVHQPCIVQNVVGFSMASNRNLCEHKIFLLLTIETIIKASTKLKSKVIESVF